MPWSTPRLDRQQRQRQRDRQDSDSNRRNRARDNNSPHKKDKKGAKKSKGGISRLLNPPFDARMRNIGGPVSPPVERGWLVMAEDHPVTKMRHRINFMYNPQTISVSHMLNPNVDLSAAPAADPTGFGPMYGFGSLDLGLLFDRTYELWDGSKENTLPGRFGCYIDVLAFYIYLGIASTEVQDNPAAQGQGGGAGSGMDFPGAIPEGAGTSGGGARATANRQVWSSLYPNQPAQAVPSYLYIGDKLKYYGRPTGLSVQYTHWNRHMVPVRCVVNMGFSLDTDPAQGEDRLGRGNRTDRKTTTTGGNAGGDSPNAPSSPNNGGGNGGGNGGRPTGRQIIRNGLPPRNRGR